MDLIFHYKHLDLHCYVNLLVLQIAQHQSPHFDLYLGKLEITDTLWRAHVVLAY